MKIDKSRFPNVTFVSDQLDMTVLSGLDRIPGHHFPTIVVYAIGGRADTAAGLFERVATPYFGEMALLENFCREHRSKFEAMADAEALPEKFFWEPTIVVTSPW